MRKARQYRAVRDALVGITGQGRRKMEEIRMHIYAGPPIVNLAVDQELEAQIGAGRPAAFPPCPKRIDRSAAAEVRDGIRRIHG